MDAGRFAASILHAARDHTEAEHVMSNQEDGRVPAPPAQDADVVLDVQELSVRKIKLEVEKLQAHLSLDVRLAQLIRLSAGVDVHIDDVQIDIEGVETGARLRVRLDQVASMLERAFAAIERNPEIFRKALEGAADEASGPLDRPSDASGDASGS